MENSGPKVDMAQMVEFYRQINKYANDNGITHKMEEPGSVRCTMTILEKHLSSPNVCHGGVIAGFMDAVIGSSALTLAFSHNELVSTVEFKINYFRPVHLGDELEGLGKIDHAGKSLITSSGEIWLKSSGEKVAKAQGTFNRYPLTKLVN